MKEENKNRQPKGELTIRTFAMPRDTNANGDIFGGWLVSQMDLGAAIAAKQRSKGRTATVAIDKMVFKRPVHVGDIICCHADIVKVGRTSMTINVEVWAVPQEEQTRHIVTEGVFTFVAIDQHGHPRPIDEE